MLTTVTPGAQELSMASSAATPPRDAPYPTLVGTATSGTPVSPPTTDGSAPSIPATTTRQSAAASRSRTPSSRCRPATPTSSIRSTLEPCTRTVSAASAATGASDVPALTTATVPRAVGIGPRVTARATGSIPASGRARATDASASSDSRVASTARSGCRSCRVRRIVTTWSGVLPAPYTTSGSPVRAARSTSTRAKPRSATRGSIGSGCSTGGTYPPVHSTAVASVGGRVLAVHRVETHWTAHREEGAHHAEDRFLRAGHAQLRGAADTRPASRQGLLRFPFRMGDRRGPPRRPGERLPHALQGRRVRRGHLGADARAGEPPGVL